MPSVPPREGIGEGGRSVSAGGRGGCDFGVGNLKAEGPDYGDPEVNPPRGRALAWRGDDLLVVVTSSGIMKSIVEAAARGDVAVSDL